MLKQPKRKEILCSSSPRAASAVGQRDKELRDHGRRRQLRGEPLLVSLKLCSALK